MAAVNVGKEPVLIAQGTGVLVASGANGSTVKILASSGSNKPSRADILANGASLAAGSSGIYGSALAQYIWAAVSTETFAPAVLTTTVATVTAASDMIKRHSSLVSRYSAQCAMVSKTPGVAPNMAVNDGDLIGYLPDLGPGNWDLAAAADDATRAVLKTGANGVGGLPAFMYNGATTRLISAASFWDQFASTGVTIIALVKLNQTVDAIRVLASAGASTAPYFAVIAKSGVNDQINFVSNAGSASAVINTSKTGGSGAAVQGNDTVMETCTCIVGTLSGAKALGTGRGTNATATGTGTGTTAGALTLLNLGSGGSFPFSIPCAEVCFYSGVLTDAEIKVECARMMNMAKTNYPVLLIDSNSFGKGYYGGVDHEECSLRTLIRGHMKAIQSSNMVVVDLSIDGDKVEAGKITTSAPHMVAVSGLGSNRKVAYLLWELVNDSANSTGLTVDQVVANAASMIKQAVAAGIRDPIVATMHAHKDGARSLANETEPRRIAINAALRELIPKLGGRVYDVVTRIPELDLMASANDTAIVGDGLHFTAKYYKMIAADFALYLQEIWYGEA